MKKLGNRSILTEKQIEELKNLVEKPNPPTQSAMAKKFG